LNKKSMLWRALLGFALSLAVAGAWAQTAVMPELSLYQEERVETINYPGGSQGTFTTKSWIKGVKMRTDALEGQDITIIRPDLGVVYNINGARKAYVETPLAIYRKASKQSIAMMAGGDITYRWTGRTKKIGKWSCREVVVSEESNSVGQEMKTIWWVSKDIGLNKQIYRHIMSIALGNEMDAATTKSLEKLTSIDGYPVQQETSIKHHDLTIKQIHTLNKLEQKPIEDSTFDLPSGLTKIAVPVPEGF